MTITSQTNHQVFRVFQPSASHDEMSLSNQTDAEVYQALQAGNTLALGEIYDRYGGAVYRLALRILGDTTEAEDLTQEVFLVFWKGGNYNPERGSIIVFLMTVTRSRAINRIRQKRSQQQLVEKWERSLADYSVDHAMEKASLGEIQQRVGEALQQLPENQRQILEMSYYQGLSQGEITKQLNIPLGTVKTRSRQGLLKLRKLLDDLVE